MKKLILCSLVAVSVAFGVDCGEMIERYKNDLYKLLDSCTDNNNADVCYCVGYIMALGSQKLLDSGDYSKAIEALGASMKFVDRACKLGSKEACSYLDIMNGERK